MEHAGEALQQIAQDQDIVLVSKQKLRLAEGITLIRTNREQGTQTVGFSGRPFVLCGLPVKQPPKGVLIHKRRNGQFRLDITGHPEYGLPFGQDRLIPIFLATLAVQTKSKTVRFRSAAAMLDTFGLEKGGKEYRRLVAGFERIFGSTIFFGTETHHKQKFLSDMERFHFLRRLRIWFARDPNQENLPGDFENEVVLSDEFFADLITHPIPVDLDIVREFRNFPALLDLFMWLAYRCRNVQEEKSIPLFGPFGLAAQLGSKKYARERRFRDKLEEWLDAIHAAWPECPAQITRDGRSLLIAPAQAIRPQTSVDC